MDEEQALATLARRYLAGYGPASAADLAYWSGLGLGAARRAFEAAGELERAGDLRALPGTLDAEEPPPVPRALLLAAFDTVLLGYRSREPVVAAAHERRVLPGGGILRPTVLARGTAAGTWRLEGSGRRRRLAVEWFGRPAADPRARRGGARRRPLPRLRAQALGRARRAHRGRLVRVARRGESSTPEEPHAV